jgi:hypothetical protein
VTTSLKQMHIVTQGGEPLSLVPVILFLLFMCCVGLVLFLIFKTALQRDRTPLNCHSLFTFYFNHLLVFCLIIHCWSQFRICKKTNKQKKNKANLSLYTSYGLYGSHGYCSTFNMYKACNIVNKTGMDNGRLLSESSDKLLVICLQSPFRYSLSVSQRACVAIQQEQYVLTLREPPCSCLLLIPHFILSYLASSRPWFLLYMSPFCVRHVVPIQLKCQ